MALLYNKIEYTLNEKKMFIDLFPKLCDSPYYGTPIQLSPKDIKNLSKLKIVEIDNISKSKLTFSKDFPEVSSVIMRVDDRHLYAVDDCLYYTINVIINKYRENIKTAVDIGAASGNVARILLNRGQLDLLLLNEFDKDICHELKEKIYSDKTNIIISEENCLELALPCNIDLLTITVDTDAVVTFLNEKRDELRSKLGNDGLFICGMLNSIGIKGYGFVNQMVIGNRELFSNWTWSNNITEVSQCFDYFDVLQFKNDIILIASNSFEKIEIISEELLRSGFHKL